MSLAVRVVPALAVAIALLWLTAAAQAGTYTVRQCDWAAGNGHHDFVWQWAGNPTLDQHAGSGCGEFGLALRNSGGGTQRTYPSGAYGGWFAHAPNGTVITHFTGMFGVLSGCCVNGMAAYGEATEHHDGSGARAYLFQGDLGDRSWYPPSGLDGPVGRSWSGFDARRVGFQLRCGPGFSCSQGIYADLRLRGRSFDFTLRDDVAPTIAATGGTLLSGGWLRGVHSLSFGAGDHGSGVTGATASFDDGTVLSAPAGCVVAGGRYARLAPCPAGHSGGWQIDTRQLPDGARALTLQTADAGGATGRQDHALHVDNTPPATPRDVTVPGGAGWRAASDFAVGWANPGGQHAPIVRARYRACPVGRAGGCVDGERAGEGIASSGPIALPHAGEWDARVWLEDAAGNADPDSASPPQRLRFDPNPPLLSFMPADPAAPERFAVATADLSGVATGEIALRRYGADRWLALATERHGDLLTAVLDERRRVGGAYDLRVEAVDAAGNRAVGYGGVRTIPDRVVTRLEATALRQVTRARRGCRPARAPRCRVPVTVQRMRVRARRGSTVALRARLETDAGRPLPGERVTVALESAAGKTQLPEARTDGAGRVALLTPVHRSGDVLLRYAGDGLRLASEARVRIDVPAVVTIAARGRAVRRLKRGRRSPLVAVGGRPVVFHGRLRGGSIPPRGKLVEVQAHFRGRWRTISTVRSQRDGRWRFAYAFRAAAGAARHRMRALAPAEGGYPFAAGASRPLAVTVVARRRAAGDR